MKIIVVGGGFTGLSAAFSLSCLNHKVTVFEKEETLGGLSGTFKLPSWKWNVEKHYHHWFTNDTFVFNLLKELGLTKYLLSPKSLTSLYYQGKIYPFNSPAHLLSFSPLTLFQRLQAGAVLLFLKLLPKKLALTLERSTAYEWLNFWFGNKTFKVLWEPLFWGKFGPEASFVNMTWFWARIKKRTLRLGYLEGGYQTLIEAMSQKIKQNGGEIILGQEYDPKKTKVKYDKIIFTIPSSIFAKLYPQLSYAYKEKLLKIPHLSALNLLFVSSEKFLESTYWLNINDRKFPFVGIIQHTNMIDPKYYGGQHLTWVANYLPQDHPYLKMTKEELFNVYLPYLKKINPNFNPQSSILNSQLFFGPFAQPVFPTCYSQIKPDFKTPIHNVYLANMDMVYPWDRGTNYAIELGYKVAEYILKSG